MSKTFWLISISSENTEKSFAPGINFQGFYKKSRKKVDVMKPDDRLLYYINDKRVFSATSTITSKMFEEHNPIWSHHDTKEVFPYRVSTKKDFHLEYDSSVDATYVSPSLEYLRKWPANKWQLAFFDMLHIISQNDFNFIENEIIKLSTRNKKIKKKKNIKPKASTKGFTRDISKKINKEVSKEIKSRFKI